MKALVAWLMMNVFEKVHEVVAMLSRIFEGVRAHEGSERLTGLEVSRMCRADSEVVCTTVVDPCCPLLGRHENSIRNM